MRQDSLRTDNPSEVGMQGFVGKTIERLDDTAINCVTILFTDGACVLLEAENAGPPVGLLRVVAYMAERPKRMLRKRKSNIRTFNDAEVGMQTFVDKTIKSVGDSAINCVSIVFTDGTRVLLEAENAGPPAGLLGLTAYDLPETPLS